MARSAFDPLVAYNAKRDFAKTVEPAAAKRTAKPRAAAKKRA